MQIEILPAEYERRLVLQRHSKNREFKQTNHFSTAAVFTSCSILHFIEKSSGSVFEFKRISLFV